MSSSTLSPLQTPPSDERPKPKVETPSKIDRARRGLWRVRRFFVTVIIVAIAGAVAAWFGLRAYRAITASSAVVVPTATVQRGDVSLFVTARGELQGGNPEVLTAPLTGGADMHITVLRGTGERVKAGDVVAQFDTTEQEFKLKEAQADLAEADQHILQANAQRDADAEDDRYLLLKAQSDVKLAELDVRRNPILAAIVAKQNDLALQNARDHLAQLEQNLANRKVTNDAAIAMQEAGRGKAEAQGTTAKQNIDAMTLRARADGYASIRPNASLNFIFDGMVIPPYQLGDSVRPGQAVAEIPDLKNWELTAKLGELDRGHIAKGDKVAIAVIAVPGHAYTGHVNDLGGMTGMFWDRHFECKIALDNPTPELRPGMNVQIVITTELMRNVLSLPAQALFENDGKSFVYAQSGKTFTPKDVKLVRRSETRVVVDGLKAGQVVALANPADLQKKKKTAAASAMQALPK